MIIAVDYDGTLKGPEGMNLPLIQRLKREQARGAAVILWTCREGKSLQEAVLELAGAGFRPNAVNQNVPEGVRRMGHDSRKVFADLYIDDKGSR